MANSSADSHDKFFVDDFRGWLVAARFITRSNDGVEGELVSAPDNNIVDGFRGKFDIFIPIRVCWLEVGRVRCDCNVFQVRDIFRDRSRFPLLQVGSSTVPPSQMLPKFAPLIYFRATGFVGFL